MEPAAWIYILANKHNTTLYIGVTNNLPTRIWEHLTKVNKGSFTARYNLTKLVYYEGFELIVEAIRREKYIKGKSRKWKDDLIKSVNPEFKDLIREIMSDQQYERLKGSLAS